MAEKLTHWKKNLDPRYISGEDLKSGIEIGRGLRPEMVVEILRFEDKETFDQNQGKKSIKTGFFLKDVESGRELYKPVLLNNTNAGFCIKEFKSDFMEHWIGKPFVLYAQADTRHGFVARFKKYFPKPTITPDKALAALEKSKDLAGLQANWLGLSSEEKNIPAVAAKKEELKAKLGEK